MTEHLRTELVLDVLNVLAFGRRCKDAGMRLSMDVCRDAYDDALAEAFFATLKTRVLMRQSFPTRGSARRAIFEYIEAFYNPLPSHEVGQVHLQHFLTGTNELESILIPVEQRVGKVERWTTTYQKQRWLATTL